MALAIDSSSPAIVTGNPTATTASFTPPAHSLLLVLFSGNDAGATLNQPTITDNLGSPLTYTLHEWYSRHDSGLFGQVAVWTAEVGASPSAMTVSVTNQDQAGGTHCAVKVHVITGQETTDPIGAVGGDHSASATAIVQSYTAEADNGQGFLAVADWDVAGDQTAGSGCTLDGSATIPTNQLTYGFLHRTNPDDSIGGLSTLTANLPGTSTNLHWAWIELLEFVGDPPEKDPPPFVMWHPPGEGLAPNGVWFPWLGTENAAPDDTGLRIHESSPGVAVQTNGATTACTTLSFTPPDGSLLLVLWSGNSINGVNPSTPTITDSLGSPLTYTLTDWQSHADSPNVDGQAAAWTAPVVTGAPMTVTVNNNAASGARHAAMQVLVLINENASPVGAHGKAGSASASAITQAYTAQANLGQGFIAVCDWDNTGAMREGIGCYLAEDASKGVIPSQLSYGFFKRTVPDDTDTVDNRLDVSLGGASTAVAWVYVEILPEPTSSVVAQAGDAHGAPSSYGDAVKVAIVEGVCSAGGRAESTRSDSRALTGLCSAGSAATGTAVKVAPQTGPASAGTAATGTAVKTTAQTGNASAGTATSGAARKAAPGTGAAYAGTTGQATGKHVAPRTGNASAGASSTGTARKVKAITGTACAGAAATHSGISTRAVTGTCSAGTSATGTAQHVTAHTGIAAAGCFTRGAAVHLAPRTGDSSAGTGSHAAVVKNAQPTGQTGAGVTGSGVLAKTVALTGLTAGGALPAYVNTARALTGHCYGGAWGKARRRHTYRPYSNTTPRPGTGTIPRPYTTMTERP